MSIYKGKKGEKMNEEKAVVKKDKNPIVESVQKRIEELQKTDRIHFPEDYSPQNAMMSAYLALQEAKDKNDAPVLDVCTKESIANSLLDMVVQGLTPAKNQGYFIAFGKSLTFMRSYFGTMAISKRLNDVNDIKHAVIWKGDTFKYHIDEGDIIIDQHDSKVENIGKEIIGAYCTVYLDGGKKYTELMSMHQIKTAWAMSKGGLTKAHKEFPDQMAKKTVINRACKYYVNTSDDSDLLIEAFNRSGDQYDDTKQIIDVGANKDSKPRARIRSEVIPEKAEIDTKPDEEKKPEEKKEEKVADSNELTATKKELISKLDYHTEEGNIDTIDFDNMKEKVDKSNLKECKFIAEQLQAIESLSNVVANRAITMNEAHKIKDRIFATKDQKALDVILAEMGKMR